MQENVGGSGPSKSAGRTPWQGLAGDGLSIFQKILMLTLALVAVTVTLPAIYLPMHQLRRTQAALEAKATTYATLVSKQVESAIAFNDRETAREVFEAVAQDPDIQSLSLVTAKGKVLRAWGEISEEFKGAVVHEGPPKLTRLSDRISVLASVVSLEGPRGTLLIELSTRRLQELRDDVIYQAIAICFVALVLGGFGAYSIARSLGRRLRAVADMADAVAGGVLDQPPLVDRSKDEIGVAARAVSAMVEQIRWLIDQIQDSAREQQAHLEGVVAERTSELHGRNADMRRILDHVGQGFLTLAKDGTMSLERSRILSTWLGEPPSSQVFADYLAGTSPDAGAWFSVGWEAVIDGFLPLELALDQLPKRLAAGEHTLELEYRPVVSELGELERVLVVISDVSAELERQRAEADEREVTGLFARLFADPSGFCEFLAETEVLLEHIKSEGQAKDLKLWLHTLKGSAAVNGIDSVSRICHALEDELSEQAQLSPERVARLLRRWTELVSKVKPLMDQRAGKLLIGEDDYHEVMSAVKEGLPHADIGRLLLAWRLETTEARLTHLGEHATRVADRLGKGPIAIEIDSGRLRLSSEPWGEFWSAAIHVVRNAVDHGLEPRSERDQLGKPTPARIAMQTKVEDGRLVVEFKDDGRGIDWTAVAAKARAAGMPATSRRDLLEALFTSGLSTRDAVSELSGRGVGLALVRDVCRKLEIDIAVDSQVGKGTTFRFSWPVSRLQLPASARSSAYLTARRERASRPPPAAAPLH